MPQGLGRQERPQSPWPKWLSAWLQTIRGWELETTKIHSQDRIAPPKRQPRELDSRPRVGRRSRLLVGPRPMSGTLGHANQQDRQRPGQEEQLRSRLEVVEGLFQATHPGR